MKKVLHIFIALLLCSNYTWAIQDFPDYNPQDTAAQIETESVLNVTDLEFKFKIAKDTMTLKPFDYGDLTISWDKIETEKDFVMFFYRVKGESWQSHNLRVKDKSAVLDGLSENLIFEYYFAENIDGSGKRTPINLFNTLCESMFENNYVKGGVQSATFHWALQHNLLNSILETYPEATFTISWNTKIGEKQHKSDKTKSPWKEQKGISVNEVKLEMDDLAGGEKFVYKIGLNIGSTTVWSEKKNFETDRSWGLFRLLVLIGSLGLFIFGMKIMSEGLQKAAGSKLRNMLASLTGNTVKGVFTGLGITSVVQSSSVTTVMTVSFVNAGLMTLRQAAGVMMGANIGTTMTAWLILLFGFKVDIGEFALVLIAFGAPLLFFSKGKIRYWSSVVIGFALLFMGLDFLKNSVPALDVDSPFVQFFIDYKNAGFVGTLMFIALGTLATIIIQSSSATMALTMTMVAGGILPFEVAAAMILGENIGTTITAQLAALIGNVHAKRAARIHAFFNIIGVFWCVFVFHFFLEAVAYFIDGDPFTDPEAANVGLAIFHSAFNIVNVLLLIWFTPKLVQLAKWSVKSRGRSDEEFHLDYIGTGMMGTPDLSILEAKKEVAKFGEITSRMSGFVQELLIEQNKKRKNELMEKIAKYEEITDRVEIEVATYLSKVSSGDMTEETASRVRTMNSIVNDLEKLGDIFFQMSKAIERKDESKIYFIPDQRKSLLDMFKLIDNAFEVMVSNLHAEWEDVTIHEALKAEEAINEKRDAMRTEHLQSIEEVGFNMESGMAFNNLYTLCEKAGDHILSATEAIAGDFE